MSPDTGSHVRSSLRGRMTPKHGTGLRYMEIAMKVTFVYGGVAFTRVVKSFVLRGGAIPPYSIWEKPSEEDTFYPSTVGKDHKT